MSLQDEPRTRITALAKQFHSLAHLKFVEDWDAIALDGWATGGRSHGEKLAAQFVLRIWNQHEEWQCGRFDVIEG